MSDTALEPQRAGARRIQSLRAFRRANVLGKSIVGLRGCGLRICCFLASLVCGLTVFEKKISNNGCMKSDKHHVQNLWEIFENPSKFIEHPSKINQKRSQIEKNTSLDRFRRQIAPRSAPGPSPEFGGLGFWSLFGRKWCSKGPFGGPAGVQNPSKIALLGLDRRRVPRKMTSGRGVGKNMNT